MLGFDSHEAMCAWDTRIRYALGEGECHGCGAWGKDPGSITSVGCRDE
jgi:hypothetical protein